MKSPRNLRPFSILLKNRIGEVEGIAQWQRTNIKYVSIDETYGIRQSQKGIQPDGSTMLVIDMKDLIAFEDKQERVYLEPFEFEKVSNVSSFFTLRPDVDMIVYSHHEYTVISVTPITEYDGKIGFLEVVANE